MTSKFLISAFFSLFTSLIYAQPITPPGTTDAHGQSFVGFGATYDATTSPKIVGHVWFATEISTKERLYSWTATDIIQGKGRALSTAVESGVAQWIRDVGPAHLYALGAAGGTIATLNGGSTLGGAFTYGGLLVIPVKGRFSVGFNLRSIKLTGATNTPSQVSAGMDVIFGR